MKKELTLLEIRKINEKNKIDNLHFVIYNDNDKIVKDQVTALSIRFVFYRKEWYKKLKREYPNDYFIDIKDEYYFRFYTVDLLSYIRWKLTPRKYFKLH